MTTYESKIQRIERDQTKCYELLNDLTRLNNLPHGELPPQIKNIEVTSDSITADVDIIGKIGLRVVGREPVKEIKFEASPSKFPANMWIQLKQHTDGSTLMKLTVKADLPFMIKAMAGSKINEGINKVAESIATILRNTIEQ